MQLAETELSAIALVEAKLPDQCDHKFLIAEHKKMQYDYFVKKTKNKACKNGNFLPFVLQIDTQKN